MVDSQAIYFATLFVPVMLLVSCVMLTVQSMQYSGLAALISHLCLMLQ